MILLSQLVATFQLIVIPLMHRWYRPNYDVAEPLRWGINEGCDFVYGGCLTE